MARLYRNMEVWQLGYTFVLEIYKICEKLPEEENNNIKSQMKRAATSIPLNIAEGSTKKTEREFLQFLGYAYGSAKELDVLLSLCKDLGYINQLDYFTMFKMLDKLTAKLFGFLSNIENRLKDKRTYFFQNYAGLLKKGIKKTEHIDDDMFRN